MLWPRIGLLFLGCASLAGASCDKPAAVSPAVPAPASAVAAPAPPRAPAPVPAAAPAPPEIELARGAGRSVDEVVRDGLARAEVDGRQLVVYVGAEWCEPCKRFHDAVVAGRLDADLPGVRFLEFDREVDEQGLVEAGYASRLIPLFVVPDAQGRGTDRRHEGGVKGDGAVDFILPRLKRIL